MLIFYSGSSEDNKRLNSHPEGVAEKATVMLSYLFIIDGKWEQHKRFRSFVKSRRASVKEAKKGT